MSHNVTSMSICIKVKDYDLEEFYEFCEKEGINGDYGEDFVAVSQDLFDDYEGKFFANIIVIMRDLLVDATKVHNWLRENNLAFEEYQRKTVVYQWYNGTDNSLVDMKWSDL